MKRCDLKELQQFCLQTLMQQRIWKKFWPLQDTVMGLQEEMFFSKLQQACRTCLCPRPQHTSLQEHIHAVDLAWHVK